MIASGEPHTRESHETYTALHCASKSLELCGVAEGRYRRDQIISIKGVANQGFERKPWTMLNWGSAMFRASHARLRFPIRIYWRLASRRKLM